MAAWCMDFCIAEQFIGRSIMGSIFLAEDQCHDQADANTEGQGEEQARESQVCADHPAGIDERQDVGGRGKEQEGDGRTQPGAFFIDTGE